jgi:Cft2 family RNA processing exonuclease
MKYRVRMDLSFADEADARSLMAYVENLSGEAVSLNEGEPNEEISFYDLEICRHDEGLPCEKLERVEIRKLLPK